MYLSKSLIFVSLLTLFLGATQALAQEEQAAPAAESGPPLMRGMSLEEQQAAFEALSEEDKQIVRKRRRDARDKQRAEWEAMTPEEREVRREEVRARAADLTPEQKEAARVWREQNQKARRNRSIEPPAVEKEAAAPPEARQQ